ncbi:enoyl-CoA hydratase/isomerase family protein [Thermodesulfobacteriota bacterium]
MTKEEIIDRESDCFTVSRMDNAGIIHFKEHMLFHVTELSTRDAVINHLDQFSKDDSIKTIELISSLEKRDQKDYFDFYDELLKSKYDLNAFYRLCNVVNQFILKIVGLDKFVIHVNAGDVIPLFFNISLACDYRIIADNTIYHNPYIEFGLLPKGGGPFFLSRILDSWKTYEILLLRRKITAQEALKFGLVDKVVPVDELERTAFEFSQNFKKIPLRTLSGIKRLKNYSMHDLEQYLELENEELRNIVEQVVWSKNPDYLKNAPGTH